VPTLRVLVVTSSFPRFPGDPSGVFILSLCKELKKLGVQIVIVAPHDYGCKRHDILEGVEIFRFPYFYPLRLQKLCYGSGILKNMKESSLVFVQPPFFILAELFYAFRIARKRKVDLVHAHWSVPQGFTGLLLRKLHGMPLVTTLHGSDVHGLDLPWLRGLNKKVILGSDVCTANSRATAERARRIAGREDIRVIPMGVDIDFFSRASERGVAEGSGGKQEKIILYAGRLIDVKGVESLINAFPAVLEKHPSAMLYIVGSGPSKGDLMSLSERLHLQERVVFQDAVSQEELVRYYSMADVFVLPSIISDRGETEGLGLVLLEAMASGIAVVGTDVGGIPDIIKDGETGLLALPKNPHDLAGKIVRLLDDEALREKTAARGFGFVNNEFSWEVVASKFRRTYEEVLRKV